MKKILFASIIATIGGCLSLYTNNASAGNTTVGLLILESGAVFTGDTSIFFTHTGSTSTGSTSTGSTGGGSSGGGGSNSSGGGSSVGGGSVVTIEPTTGLQLSGSIIPPLNLSGSILTGEISTGGNSMTGGVVLPTAPLIAPNIIDTEVITAYQWAKGKGITTMPTIEKARLDKPLLRSELAKMMSLFIKEVYSTTLVSNPSCKVNNFKDAYQMDSEEKGYIEEACSYGIMGWKADKSKTTDYFNPHGVVTRAQFGTVLSRFLYGKQYDGDMGENTWYKKHLTALKEQGIMKKIDQPLVNEIRGYVFLMLQRISKK